MRVAVVVDSFPNPSETFVFTEIEGLLEYGCHIDVYADQAHDHGQLRGALQVISSHGTSESHRVRQLQRRIGMGRHWIKGSLGFSNAFSLASRFGESAYKAAAFGPVERAVRYDVIHAHFGPNGLKALTMRLLGLIDGPLVTSFHGYDMRDEQGSSEQVPAGYAELFHEGALFLPVSNFFAARLRSWGCPPDRIAVHPMGVSIERFRHGDRKPGDGPTRIISVGRMVPKKGFERGIEAVAMMAEPAQYVIVGDGPLKGKLQRRIEALKAQDRIRIVGWQSNERIAELLSRADIYLAPSETPPSGDEEGIPVSIMEAMATELPIVSTRHAGIPELVEDDLSGILVAESDVAAMSAALSRLAQSPELRRSMGSAGRARINRSYDTRLLVQQLMNLYRSVAETPVPLASEQPLR